MDNITHSLIGLAVGRAVIEVVARKSKTKAIKNRTAILVTSAIANNAPDGDILFAALIGDGKIGHLLHHRGFTHTFLAAPFLGILSVIIALFFLRLFKKKYEDKNIKSYLLLAAVGTLGVFTHVFADFWNDFGVHPLAPFSGKWFYGDFIFIIEPYVWMSLAWALSERKTEISIPSMRAFKYGIFLLALGLMWFYPQMSFLPALGSTFFAAFAFAWGRYFKSAFVKIIPLFIVLLFFRTGSNTAKDLVRENLLNQDIKNYEINDILVSPSPGNFFCFRTIVGGFQKAEDRYIVQMGYVSLLPQVFDPAQCHVRKVITRSVQLEKPNLLSSPNVLWTGTNIQKISDFKKFSAMNCTFFSSLHFARFPFVIQTSDNWLFFGDHRFDFNDTAGFAEFLTPLQVDKCLRVTTPWHTRFSDALGIFQTAR